jgi:hypothetical protein
VRFAGGDDPIEFLDAACYSVERLLRSAHAECEFIFIFGGVSKGFDSGAKAKFAGRRHAEGPIDFLGRNFA